MRGVLRAGNLIAGDWADGRTLDQDDGKRRTAVVQQLTRHSRDSEGFFKTKTDDELIGMCGAVLFLLGHGNRDRAWLQTTTAEDHRNTLVVVLADMERKRREIGKDPRWDGADVERITPDFFHKTSTRRLVEWATHDKAWLRLHFPPIRGANALNAPTYSPGEAFSKVTRQLYGNAHIANQEAKSPPAMTGFLKDYVHVLKYDRGCTDDEIIRYGDQIMRSYTPDQLPVLNGLAKHYAVSDMWFSSVPSQTNANEAFSFCGRSNGLVNNGFLEEGGKGQIIEQFVGYRFGDDKFPRGPS